MKTVTVLARPESLVPYETTTSKVTTIVVIDQGQTETTLDTETSRTRYAY